jgi:hypothetical protein
MTHRDLASRGEGMAPCIHRHSSCRNQISYRIGLGQYRRVCDAANTRTSVHRADKTLVPQAKEQRHASRSHTYSGCRATLASRPGP